MTNDGMMTEGGWFKDDKAFSVIFYKPSLEICLVTTKEGIVTLRVAGLAVPGCKGLSTMVRRPTYAVLSQNQFCRELRAHGRGEAKK